jgi:cation diffusion facilitator CzcD-associated flavoprotein CzcO
MGDNTILSSSEAAASIQQKYSEERSKRLRSGGISQYVDLSKSEKFKHFYDDPWINPNAPENRIPALKDGNRCDFLILGAGFGGLLFAVRLIEAGIPAQDICIVDSAGGFGGTWYWNRYPGLMCDVESYIYMPLLEETGYMPKHKYASGSELREYAESIAEKWQFKDRAIFQTEAKDLKWDNDGREWVVKLSHEGAGKAQSDITVRSRFVVTASGVLNFPKLSDLHGIESFQGHSFHTSRWDYKITGGSPTDPSLTNLKGKRVGIVGTGATAVQAAPQLAKWAKKLYVFQRTPSAVNVRGNRPTDTEWWAREIQGKKGWQKERFENFNAHLSSSSPKPPIDLVDDGWTKMPQYSALIGGPAEVTPDSIPVHIASFHDMDLPHQEMVRERVEKIVQDPNTAKKLKPWYPTWCKRPCFHDEYLQTFNLPNVALVDTNGQGVDRVSKDGILVGDTEYPLDVLIFSTGFRIPTISSPAARANMSVTGRNGRTMDQKWAENVGTLHGVITREFPNLFFPGMNQAAATANHTFVLDQLATHVAYIVSETARKIEEQNPSGKKYDFVIEPTVQGEEDWSMQVMTRAMSFAALAGCTPSYLNMEGEIDRRPGGLEEQMKAARGAIWGRGIADYVSVIEDWRRQGDLKGLEIARGS